MDSHACLELRRIRSIRKTERHRCIGILAGVRVDGGHDGHGNRGRDRLAGSVEAQAERRVDRTETNFQTGQSEEANGALPIKGEFAAERAAGEDRHGNLDVRNE